MPPLRTLSPLDEFRATLSRWSSSAGLSLPAEWAATVRVLRARHACLSAALMGTRATPGLLDESRRLATERPPLSAPSAGCAALRALARRAVLSAIDPETMVMLRRVEAVHLCAWLEHADQLISGMIEADDDALNAAARSLLSARVEETLAA